MATHFSVLAWRIPGTGKPGGLPSMGSHRVRHDWSELAAAAVHVRQGLPGWLSGKDSACNAGNVCSIPGSERYPGRGNGNPLQYSYMRNSIDRGACGLQSMGSQRVRCHWVTKQQQRKKFQQNHCPSCSKTSSMWTYFSFICSWRIIYDMLWTIISVFHYYRAK